MDDETRARVNKILIDARLAVPSELRGKEDRAPFTPEQIAEIHALFGNPNKQTPQGAQA